MSKKSLLDSILLYPQNRFPEEQILLLSIFKLHLVNKGFICECEAFQISSQRIIFYTNP